MLTDRLGSVDAIANSAGNLIETRGFDAFGKPRTGTWADATPPRLTSTATTRHGFTGHEHLDSLQLIHMNGRVYDYNLGRFMEVDPVVQFPMNSQSLNPYSYLLNNPLSGTDPTGYMLCSAPRWVCFYLDQQDQPRGPPMLIHADSPGWSVGEGGGNGATTKKRKSSSTPDEIGSAQKREPSNTSGDDIAGINANAKQSGKPIYGDPDPETIRDSVVKNANLAPYVTVDPKTGALSARIPYVVEQGTDPALQSAFEAEVESRLSGTFTKGVLRWKKTITIQVDLVQSATGVFTLGTCTSTCASPAIQGATIGDINKPANRIEIAPMARSGTRVHEFLHLSGLGHQWNSTNSIMSYSADRRVLFSDVERFYDAYRH
jgi:RHS repeat-associated protein